MMAPAPWVVAMMPRNVGGSVQPDADHRERDGLEEPERDDDQQARGQDLADHRGGPRVADARGHLIEPVLLAADGFHLGDVQGERGGGCNEERAGVDDRNCTTTLPCEESRPGNRSDEADALPERLQDAVGIAEQFLRQHLAKQRGFSRAENAIRHSIQHHHEVDQPHLVASVHQQQEEDAGAERKVGRDQEWTLLQAVDEHAGRGGQHRRCAEREEREAC